MNLCIVCCVCRLLLLTIPFPSVLLNKGIVKFGDLVFNIRVGTLSIFSIITTISFIVLCGTFVERGRIKRTCVHWMSLTMCV